MSLESQPDEDDGETTLPDEAAAIAERLEDLEDADQMVEYDAVFAAFDDRVSTSEE